MAENQVVLTIDGSPFASERAAALRAAKLAKEGKHYTPIPWTGKDPEGNTIEGFALERTDAKRRPERIPVGTRDVLTAPRRPGFVRRFVNDDPGRVKMFERAGYQVVTQENFDPSDPQALAIVGDNIDSNPLGSVVTEEVGGGKRAVLMEIREDWFREDQEEKQRKIDAQMAQIKRRPKIDGYYGGIRDDFTGSRTPNATPASAADMDQGHFDE